MADLRTPPGRLGVGGGGGVSRREETRLIRESEPNVVACWRRLAALVMEELSQKSKRKTGARGQVQAHEKKKFMDTARARPEPTPRALAS